MTENVIILMSTIFAIATKETSTRLLQYVVLRKYKFYKKTGHKSVKNGN